MFPMDTADGSNAALKKERQKEETTVFLFKFKNSGSAPSQEPQRRGTMRHEILSIPTLKRTCCSFPVVEFPRMLARYRHVDTLSIINVPEMENFIGYWSGIPRAARGRSVVTGDLSVM